MEVVMNQRKSTNQNHKDKSTATNEDAQSGHKKGITAPQELEGDVAKLTSNTGESTAHKSNSKPPLAGQATG
jgi:hypothetical protein